MTSLSWEIMLKAMKRNQWKCMANDMQLIHQVKCQKRKSLVYFLIDFETTWRQNWRSDEHWTLPYLSWSGVHTNSSVVGATTIVCLTGVNGLAFEPISLVTVLATAARDAATKVEASGVGMTRIRLAAIFLWNKYFYMKPMTVRTVNHYQGVRIFSNHCGLDSNPGPGDIEASAPPLNFGFPIVNLKHYILPIIVFVIIYPHVAMASFHKLMLLFLQHLPIYLCIDLDPIGNHGYRCIGVDRRSQSIRRCRRSSIYHKHIQLLQMDKDIGRLSLFSWRLYMEN